MIYLETNSTDPTYNLAFEQYVLENCTDDDYLILWQNDNTIVVGQNQNVEEEINRSFVDAHHITIVRRMTGGGAVYHDLGNLNYSFITDAGNAEERTKEKFTLPIVQALTSLGLQSEASGRNDILVNGKKISGTAQRINKDRILHHGTLLFSSNPDMIAGSLHADPSKFASKSVKSVRSRIGNISEELTTIGRSMTLDMFWNYLKDFLAANAEFGALNDLAFTEITKLQMEKYRSYEWTYGRSPKFSFQNKKRFAGGSLEIQAAIADGCIKEISFFGDFLSQTGLEPLCLELIACRFEKQAFMSILAKHNIQQMFGSITIEEISSVLFD